MKQQQLQLDFLVSKLMYVTDLSLAIRKNTKRCKTSTTTSLEMAVPPPTVKISLVFNPQMSTSERYYYMTAFNKLWIFQLFFLKLKTSCFCDGVNNRFCPQACSSNACSLRLWMEFCWRKVPQCSVGMGLKRLQPQTAFRLLSLPLACLGDLICQLLAPDTRPGFSFPASPTVMKMPRPRLEPYIPNEPLPLAALGCGF